MVRIFHADASAAATASPFLQLTSWTLVAQSLAYACSATFQGLGNTAPALLSSAIRFVLLSVLAIWLSRRDCFRVEEVWYAMAACFLLQAIVSLSLLNHEFRKRLGPSRICGEPVASRGIANERTR